jgi:hypothetical protein
MVLPHLGPAVMPRRPSNLRAVKPNTVMAANASPRSAPAVPRLSQWPNPAALRGRQPVLHIEQGDHLRNRFVVLHACLKQRRDYGRTSCIGASSPVMTRPLQLDSA